jgi:hypothetical protein
MLTPAVTFLNGHSTYSQYLAKPIEQFMKNPNLDNHLKARVSFLGMGMIAFAEAITTLAGSLLAAAAYALTFCQIGELKNISYELLRIGCFNTLTTVASTVGSIINPKGGVWLIKESSKPCHDFFKG